MSIFNSMDLKDKTVRATFFDKKTQQHIPGEYLINLCQELKVSPICKSPKISEEIRPKGTSDNCKTFCFILNRTSGTATTP